MRPFPVGFDPSMSVLFLGAGFSAEATNVLGKGLPTGSDLERELKARSGLEPDDPSELQDLASYAASVGQNVQAILSDLFTVTALSDNQSIILSQPWLRIYTTNYDDICAAYFKKIKDKRPIFSIEDSAPKHLRPGSVVHLHGYIHRISEENVLDQLVLTRRSYARQGITSSVWWDFFEKDLRVCENFFLIGYEMRDLEPSKYLTKQPDIATKTHFVLRPTRSPVAENRLSEYGTRHSISVSGFAEHCTGVVIKERPDHSNALHALKYIDIISDGRAPVNPTPTEVQSLYAFGKFQFSRLVDTYPALKYIVPRSAEINQCLEKIGENSSIILHAKIGNGKTLFWKALSFVLSQKGYQCYEVRDGISVPEQDISFLRKVARPIIYFPSFDSVYSNIHLFADMPEETRFVTEMTTANLEVRGQEVFATLPGNILRINLNHLSRNDCADLFKILNGTGTAPIDFQTKFGRGRVEFRDIVLSVYEHPPIAEKLRRLVGPILSNPSAKFVFFYTALLKSINAKVDQNFIREILDVDVYQILSLTGEATHEFVSFSADSIEPHSSIFSEYAIKSFLGASEIVSVVFHVASAAARRINEETLSQSDRFRASRAILSSVMRYGFIAPLLEKHQDRGKHLRNLYERMREDRFINEEPLFWLQYSIFMQDMGSWDVAERHMETAYVRSQARPGFRTYQLDTNYLGLCLELENRAPVGTALARLEKIRELLEKCRAMIGEGSHRAHVFKVLLKVEATIRKRASDLSRSEANGLVFDINLLTERLKSLSIDDKALWDVDTIILSLSRSISVLTRAN